VCVYVRVCVCVCVCVCTCVCAYVCVGVCVYIRAHWSICVENVYKIVCRKSSRLCMLLQVFPFVFVCVCARARASVCISMQKCLHKYECVQECLWKVVSMCVAVALMALGEIQCVAVCVAVYVVVCVVFPCVFVCVCVRARACVCAMFVESRHYA